MKALFILLFCLQSICLHSAVIQVNFINSSTSDWNSNPQAKTAFQHAASIWGNILNSNVTIKIDAYLEDFRATYPTEPWKHNALGFANTTAIASNFSSTDPKFKANIGYAVALGEKLAAANLNGTSTEINAHFNINPSLNWYFGTDKVKQSGKYDFVTVVMHEICHGMGFASSAHDDAGTLKYNQSLPYSFDQYPIDGLNKLLTSIPASGATTTSYLTSNDMFWNGVIAKTIQGARPQLYAPTTWEVGSSISHFDEDYYLPNSGVNPNALMTPVLIPTEIYHSPGPVGHALLRDIGWDGVLSIEEQPAQSKIQVFPNPTYGRIEIHPDEPVKKLRVFDSLGKTVLLIDQLENTEDQIQLDISDLKPGIYYLEIDEMPKTKLLKL